MKKASIISIGNEIISGQTVDTNAAWLSRELLSASIPVVSVYVIGDDIEKIVKTFNHASIDADIVLVTGGLGPTDDDLTRHALAKFLNVELVLQNELLEKIQKIFADRNIKMPEMNRIQACIPAGAKPISNNLGTAPGVIAETKDKIFASMPGVPSEMKAMFCETVLPRLKELTAGQAVVIKKLKCFGAGESTIAESLGSLMHRDRNPLINCTVQYGIVTLHIIATAKTHNSALQMAEKDEKTLRDILGDLIYGTDDQTLAEVVGQKLAAQHKTLVVAESCTGGLLAKLITDIPGASEYFLQGWVTYSNQAKIHELHVPPHLVEQYGAVSEQVAQAMAQNARKKASADFSLAITGIAGPGGGNEQKPVGLVYISSDSQKGCQTACFVFSHDRDFIRFRAALTALNMLRLKL